MIPMIISAVTGVVLACGIFFALVTVIGITDSSDEVEFKKLDKHGKD